MSSIKHVIFLYLLFVSVNAFAALPPRVQNQKDMDVMQAFIKSHKKVSSTFQSINTYAKEVYFGKECVAKFGRKKVFHLPGWVGPASALEFKSSNCKID